MLSDLQKSLYSIFNERIKNPLYGALILAWCFWNWEIIYTTVFVSQDLVGNKIDYIKLHYWQFNNLVCRPIYSALILVFLFPLLNIVVTAAQSFYHRCNTEVRDRIMKTARLSINESVLLTEKYKRTAQRHLEAIEEKNAALEQIQVDLNERNDRIISLERDYKGMTKQWEDAFNERDRLKADNHKLLDETGRLNKQILESRGNNDWYETYYAVKINEPFFENLTKLYQKLDTNRPVPTNSLEQDFRKQLKVYGLIDKDEYNVKLLDKGKFFRILMQHNR